MGTDEALLRTLNEWTLRPAVAWLALLLSSRAIIVAVCGPLAWHLARARRWRAVVTIAVAMAAADAVTARLLKPAFDRPRPCHALEALRLPAPCGTGDSMPSGHATVAFAFLATAGPAIRYGWVLLTPLAAAVALSRVVLAVHFPSDVVAGAGFGLLIGWAARRLFSPAP